MTQFARCGRLPAAVLLLAVLARPLAAQVMPEMAEADLDGDGLAEQILLIDNGKGGADV